MFRLLLGTGDVHLCPSPRLDLGRVTTRPVRPCLNLLQVPLDDLRLPRPEHENLVRYLAGKLHRPRPEGPHDHGYRLTIKRRVPDPFGVPRLAPQLRIRSCSVGLQKVYSVSLHLKANRPPGRLPRLPRPRPEPDERPAPGKFPQARSEIGDDRRVVHKRVAHALADMDPPRVHRSDGHHAEAFPRHVALIDERQVTVTTFVGNLRMVRDLVEPQLRPEPDPEVHSSHCASPI